MKIPERDQLYAEIGIAPRFWQFSKKNFSGDPKSFEKVKQYCLKLSMWSRNGIGINLMGDTFSGKTALLSIILINAAEEGYTCKYVHAAEVTDAYFGGDYGKNFLREFQRPHFLAVDEVNTPSNKGQAQALSQLVKVRNDASRPLLLASAIPNYEQFEGIGGVPGYGDETVFRLMNTAQLIECSVGSPTKLMQFWERMKEGEE